jgi:hypothetical protein
MWVIPHQETGVACSRNSPPSPAGRPSAVLLHRAFSEPTGGRNVRYKSTAVSPSTSTASFFVCLYQRPLCSLSSALPRSASTPAPLLVTLVAISRPCLVQAFCALAGLEISTLIRLFNHGSRFLSLFGNLILV